MLDAVYNIIEWLVGYAEQLHDHSQPKCYKFFRNASGKRGMFYVFIRSWTGDVGLLSL